MINVRDFGAVVDDYTDDIAFLKASPPVLAM